MLHIVHRQQTSAIDMMLASASLLALVLILLLLLPWSVSFANEKDSGSPALTGDPVHGQIVYQRCSGCHSLERNRTGPRHCGLIGRRAGSLAGFDYTEAMKQSNIIWTRESLDNFLAAPLNVVPGTSMGFAGIESRQERLDLIAYIEQAAHLPGLCRSPP